MKKWSDMLKNLTMLTQFGLSLITPLLLCLGLCWYLNTHAGLGSWIYIPGFFFGLGGSGTFAYNTLRSVADKEKKKEKGRKDVGFNRHD